VNAGAWGTGGSSEQNETDTEVGDGLRAALAVAEVMTSRAEARAQALLRGEVEMCARSEYTATALQVARQRLQAEVDCNGEMRTELEAIRRLESGWSTVQSQLEAKCNRASQIQDMLAAELEGAEAREADLVSEIQSLRSVGDVLLVREAEAAGLNAQVALFSSLSVDAMNGTQNAEREVSGLKSECQLLKQQLLSEQQYAEVHVAQSRADMRESEARLEVAVKGEAAAQELVQQLQAVGSRVLEESDLLTEQKMACERELVLRREHGEAVLASLEDAQQSVATWEQRAALLQQQAEQAGREVAELRAELSERKTSQAVDEVDDLLADLDSPSESSDIDNQLNVLGR